MTEDNHLWQKSGKYLPLFNINLLVHFKFKLNIWRGALVLSGRVDSCNILGFEFWYGFDGEIFV